MRGLLRGCIGDQMAAWRQRMCRRDALPRPRARTLRPPCLRPARRSCFALEDQKEGMAAFVQKRAPVWQHK